MGVTQLSSTTRALWAKKRTVDGQQLWLPLVAHLQDCANVIDQLRKLWLSEHELRLLTTTMSTDELRRLLRFIALTHDIGKATAAFQTKQSYDGSHDLDQLLVERLTRVGFSGLGAAKIAAPEKSPHALAGEAILERSGVPVSIAAVVGGHHGRITSNIPADDICDHTANYWQSDSDPTLQKPWQRVQEQLIDFALAEAGYFSVNELPELTLSQSILVEGLLITADWLSSSEYLNNDVSRPLFPLIDIDQSLTDIDLTQRFQQAWLTWQTSEGWAPEPVPLTPDPYQERWHFHARPVQQTVTAAVDAAKAPGLVIIEAPMGSGKTEMALLAAEQLANKCGCNGLFFGLPTQATTNAMFHRIKTWLQRQADEQDGKLSIELLHSKAKFNEEFRQLPVARAVAEDEPDAESTVVVNTWFSGKKSILDNFTVGTIDNLLQLALQQKHLTLRHLGLAGKVVCIDEAHAYDAYMLTFLDRALEWLGAYQVPVVILSATLPKQRRNELLGAYYRGRFGKGLDKDADLSAVAGDWRESEAYPLVTLLDGRTVRQVTDFAGHSDQPTLKLKVTRIGDDPAELMAKVTQAVAGGGVAGVIVNTVKRAQQLAQLVPADIPTLVLHSSFLATDRTALEERLIALIGKNGQRPQRLIVIGTQVLEQSLDIDFDILFTDIAPMDLLLQRAGRLHRHQQARPAALQVPQLVVACAQTPGDYGAANEAVYSRYLLMRTDAALGNEIDLPTDISPLVQQVYSFTDDPQWPEIDTARQAFFDELAQKRAKAKTFLLSKPEQTDDETLHEWQTSLLPGADTDDQRGVAAVRDIDESIEVVLVQQAASGYQLLDGRPLGEVTDQEIAMQVIRLPAMFAKRWTIEKTIRLLEQETSTHFAHWQQSRWLRGALALVLDTQANGELGTYQLHYSHQLGLMYQTEKEEANGKSTL